MAMPILKHPNQVFKATDLVDVTVDKDHKPHTNVQGNVPDTNTHRLHCPPR